MSAKLDKLREALGLIAAPADRQIETLAEMGHFEGHEATAIDGEWNIDEIALQFDDAEIFLTGLLERKEIDVSQLECITRLKAKLAQHSGIENSRFWTVDAIKNDPEWDNIRKSAQECLIKLEFRGNDT